MRKARKRRRKRRRPSPPFTVLQNRNGGGEMSPYTESFCLPDSPERDGLKEGRIFILTQALSLSSTRKSFFFEILTSFDGLNPILIGGIPLLPSPLAQKEGRTFSASASPPRCVFLLDPMKHLFGTFFSRKDMGKTCVHFSSLHPEQSRAS